jgi:hypothetical protein
MPNAVFIPAELNDLSVDVALGTPAQGAVLYRGATKWNNLAAGTSGKVLQTNGAGADPSWVTVDLTTLVTLAPASVNRNLIQPAADNVHALVLQSHSATQSEFLFRTKTAAGTTLVAMGDPVAGNQLFSFSLPNGVNGTLIGANTGNTDNPSQFPMAVFSAFDTPGNYYGEFFIEYDGAVTFWHPTSAAGNDERVGRITHGMLDNTDGAYKGRMSLLAFDTATRTTGRAFLVGEADGTAARVGFLGAAAVVRQTLPAAASDPTTTQALANALRSLAITFGLAN